jgi:HPt (histidine-containing phosphotransfer) domain-containing protein
MSDVPNDSEDQIFMEELKQEFKENVSKNIVELYQLFEAKDIEGIARISHDLKGTSGIFGYEEGSEIAKNLNIAAKNNEIDKIKEIIDQLSDYLKRENLIS